MQTQTSGPMARRPESVASLYVGNLRENVDENVVQAIFAAVAPVQSVRVCRDVVTRESLGYAYVNFNTKSDAERCLDKLNYTAIQGQACRIMWVQNDFNSKKNSKSNIFVRNLDRSISNKDLHETFSMFGKILSCKIAQDRDTGESLGYGYVFYDSPTSASKAIEKINGIVIAEKTVTVEPFVPASDRTKELTNIYIKNYPKGWTDEDLLSFFGKFGDINSPYIPRDGSGNPKGFAMINYNNTTSVNKALEVNGTEVDGNRIYVSRAEKKADRKQKLKKDFQNRRAATARHKAFGCSLFVQFEGGAIDAGEANDLHEDDITLLFQKYCNVNSVRIPRMKDSGKSKGFAFVNCKNPSGATRCITELNGTEFLGRKLTVELQVMPASGPNPMMQQQMMMGNMGGMNGMNPMATMGSMGAMGGFQNYYGGMMTPGMGPAGMTPGMNPMYPPMYPPGGMMPQHPQMAGYGNPQIMQRVLRQQQNESSHSPFQNPRERNNHTRGNMQNGRQQDRGYNQRRNGHPMANGNQQQPRRPQRSQPQAPTVNSGPLDPQMLAQAPPERQKQMIGEKLFPLVQESIDHPEMAGKVTGMLLEMDITELLLLFEQEQTLQSRIAEAVQVLREHAGQTFQ